MMIQLRIFFGSAIFLLFFGETILWYWVTGLLFLVMTILEWKKKSLKQWRNKILFFCLGKYAQVLQKRQQPQHENIEQVILPPDQGMNAIIVSYRYRDKLYKIPVFPARGPSPISLVLDENSEDITDLFLSWYGPARDFHHLGHMITCAWIGKENITVHFTDGTVRDFKQHEPLLC